MNIRQRAADVLFEVIAELMGVGDVGVGRHQQVQVNMALGAGATLPDLDTYLPRLVSLHVGAIKVARERPRFLEDYTEAFKLDVSGLLALGPECRPIRLHYR